MKMGRAKRHQILVALGLIMFMGTAVYLRLWTIDYRISSNDTELLRREFDLANREAMDESAEWRRRYDSELENAAKCFRELKENKKSIGEATRIYTLNKKMEMLQMVPFLGLRFTNLVIVFIFSLGYVDEVLIISKREICLFSNHALHYQENMDLLERVESLKQELEAEKLKCSMRNL